MSDTQTFRDAVAAYFEARPDRWIDAVTIEGIGGRQAWRTRISECRRDLKMDIRNRQRFSHIEAATKRRWTISEYMFVPAVAHPPQPSPETSVGHDTNRPTEGRLI